MAQQWHSEVGMDSFKLHRHASGVVGRNTFEIHAPHRHCPSRFCTIHIEMCHDSLLTIMYH